MSFNNTDTDVQREAVEGHSGQRVVYGWYCRKEATSRRRDGWDAKQQLGFETASPTQTNHRRERKSEPAAGKSVKSAR